MNDRGSMLPPVSLSILAVSHFMMSSPRLGTIAMPLAAVVDLNSEIAKHQGFSSTHS